MTKARDLASGAPAPAGVTTTELGFVDGVTSAIQTQLNAKAVPANVVNNTLADAKGDLIVGTGADTFARLAVSPTNGDTIVADSSTATGLRYQGNYAAGKNAMINGGFDIWQRGTSVAANAVTAYTADRWQIAPAAAGLNTTITRQATNDTTNLPFIQYCSRVQRNSGVTANGYIQFFNAQETINSIPYAGKTVTVSFYARAGANYSSGSNDLGFQLRTGTGTDQVASSYTGLATPIDTTFTLTTTWQRFTATGTIATTATELGLNFYYLTTGTAGANDYYEITGVQLELGSVATAFARNSGTIQGELAACQRYYTRESVTTNYCYLKGFGNATTTSLARIIVPFPVEMRVKPSSMDKGASLAVSDGANLFSGGSFVLSTNSTTESAQVEYTNGTAALTQFRYYGLQDENTGATFLGFSAEL